MSEDTKFSRRYALFAKRVYQGEEAVVLDEDFNRLLRAATNTQEEAETYLLRAESLLNDQRRDEALRNLEKALKLSYRPETRRQILAEMTRAKRGLGDLDGALAAAEEALRLTGPDSPAYAALAVYADEIKYDIANPEPGFMKRLARFFRRASHGLAMMG